MRTQAFLHVPGTRVVFEGYQARDLISLIRSSGWTKPVETSEPYVLEALLFIDGSGEHHRLSLEPTEERSARYGFRLEELKPAKPNRPLELVGYGEPGIANAMLRRWRPLDGEENEEYAGFSIQFHPVMPERRLAQYARGTQKETFPLPGGGISTSEIEITSLYRGVLIALT